MKRLFIIFAIIAVNSIFTSCTDLTEDTIEEQQELEIQNTGGEEDPTPVEDDEED